MTTLKPQLDIHVVGSPSQTQVTLGWRRVDYDEGPGVRLTWNEENLDNKLGIDSGTTLLDSQTISITGLKPNSTYLFRIHEGTI